MNNKLKIIIVLILILFPITQIKSQHLFCIDTLGSYTKDIDTMINKHRIKREIIQGEMDTVKISLNKYYVYYLLTPKSCVNSDSSIFVFDTNNSYSSNIYFYSDSLFVMTLVSYDCQTSFFVYSIIGDSLFYKFCYGSFYPFIYIDKKTGSILSFSSIKYKNDIYSEKGAYREVNIYNVMKNKQNTKRIYLYHFKDGKYFNIDDYDIAMDFYFEILNKYVN